MEIKTSIIEGTYDFEMKLDEYKPQGDSVYQLTLGDQILIVTREEWEKLYSLVIESMDYFENIQDYV
jgi:hypothetical protein